MEKTKKTNRKKALVVTSISALTILGGTLAYFTTSSSIENTFKTAFYQNKIVEEFTSPTSWTPGTTTSKTVKVTNTGSMDMALRASYTENWTSANGETLSLKDSDGNVASIINFNEGWTKDSDGYYYYGSKSSLTALKAGETSSSFISGVTFNENIKTTLKETVSDDGKTITYTSTGNGYDNATYTLKINIDTIQYDQAANAW